MSSRFTFLLLACGILHAQPKVVVAPLDDSIPAGVAVLTQSDPSFEPLFDGLVSNALLRPLFQPILPYSIIVQNNSTVPICAVNFLVEVVDAQGQRSSGVRKMEINPDGRFTLPLGGSIFFSVAGTYTDAAWRLRRNANAPMRPEFYAETQNLPAPYDSAKGITFGLDGVLFSDGRFVGPDTGHSFERYADELAAELALSKAILGFEGQSVADLEKYLAWVASPSREPLSRYDSRFQQLAAAVQGRMRQKGPDAAFTSAQSLQREAIRCSPIHR